jgi:hypothetical protein
MFRSMVNDDVRSYTEAPVLLNRIVALGLKEHSG